MVVDEGGPLELQGGGFLPGRRPAFPRAFLVLTVRPALVAAWSWFGEEALLVPVAGAPAPPTLAHPAPERTRVPGEWQTTGFALSWAQPRG
ncbi:MAG: hypothetical protein ABDI20_06910 [Candidatus Bipolaricaulaceae bacterium]